MLTGLYLLINRASPILLASCIGELECEHTGLPVLPGVNSGETPAHFDSTGGFAKDNLRGPKAGSNNSGTADCISTQEWVSWSYTSSSSIITLDHT